VNAHQQAVVHNLQIFQELNDIKLAMNEKEGIGVLAHLNILGDLFHKGVPLFGSEDDALLQPVEVLLFHYHIRVVFNLFRIGHATDIGSL